MPPILRLYYGIKRIWQNELRLRRKMLVIKGSLLDCPASSVIYLMRSYLGWKRESKRKQKQTSLSFNNDPLGKIYPYFWLISIKKIKIFTLLQSLEPTLSRHPQHSTNQQRSRILKISLSPLLGSQIENLPLLFTNLSLAIKISLDKVNFGQWGYARCDSKYDLFILCFEGVSLYKITPVWVTIGNQYFK